MEMEQQTTNIDLTETLSPMEYRSAPSTPAVLHISEERRLEITNEISKLEDEIYTLKQALLRKERQLQGLRTELGITRWSRIQNSEAVNKSKQALADATIKTSQALKDLSTATANKWSEIKESPRMQTVSERFWLTTDAVKSKFLIGRVAMRRAIENTGK